MANAQIGQGDRQWVELLGTDGWDEAWSVAADGSGNAYVICDTDGGLGGRSYNGGANDVFVAAYGGTGKCEWVRLVGTDGKDRGKEVVTGGSGGVYVVGLTDSSLAGREHQGGKGDGFVVKYDGSGAHEWVRLLGASALDSATAVATDGSGHIYVGGVTEGRGLDGGEYGPGTNNPYVAQFDAAGSRNWVRLVETSDDGWAFGLAAGSSGATYLGGRTTGGFGGQDYNGGPRDGFVQSY